MFLWSYFYANVKRMNESKFALIYIGIYIKKIQYKTYAMNSRNIPDTGVSLIQHISVSVTANVGQVTASLVCDVQPENTQLCQKKSSRWQVFVRLLKWDKWMEVLLHSALKLSLCRWKNFEGNKTLIIISFRETKLNALLWLATKIWLFQNYLTRPH